MKKIFTNNKIVNTTNKISFVNIDGCFLCKKKQKIEWSWVGKFKKKKIIEKIFL